MDTEFIITDCSACKTGHRWGWAKLVHESNIVEADAWKPRKACFASISAVWFWVRCTLKILVLLCCVQFTNCWARCLILQSGGFACSSELKNRTSSSLCDRKFVSWSPNWAVIAAEAIAAASAIRTDTLGWALKTPRRKTGASRLIQSSHVWA
jgi:hypothetical protein